jgi:hypothetical protein
LLSEINGSEKENISNRYEEMEAAFDKRQKLKEKIKDSKIRGMFRDLSLKNPSALPETDISARLGGIYINITRFVDDTKRKNIKEELSDDLSNTKRKRLAMYNDYWNSLIGGKKMELNLRYNDAGEKEYGNIFKGIRDEDGNYEEYKVDYVQVPHKDYNPLVNHSKIQGDYTEAIYRTKKLAKLEEDKGKAGKTDTDRDIYHRRMRETLDEYNDISLAG